MTTSRSFEHFEKATPFNGDVASDLHLADFSTPIATISGGDMARNIRAMALWCAERGLSLAPHGKTTMAPSIWQQQLDAGAWAITVATPAQLRVAWAAKVPRVIVANELIDPVALRWTYAQLQADPNWQVICWVDSLKGVELMASEHDGHSRPIDVCVEIGSVDARAGTRSQAEARQIAQAVNETPALRLVGVAGYEGVLVHGADPQEIAKVDGYLRRLVEAHLDLLPFYETPDVIISAGGSAYFDRVHSILGAYVGSTDHGHVARVVLRSGVYVVHDDGLYKRISPLGRGEGPDLVSAMNVWARVLSRPQPNLALLDAGRRDLSFDAGMPVAERVHRDGEWLSDELLVDANIFDLNDQHAFMSINPASSITVGDVVRLGVSHPCTTFDKWSTIAVVDDSDSANPRVTDFIRTRF
jgi:D-serine deaminase-like pyridoxal phosphate-dependent protein